MGLLSFLGLGEKKKVCAGCRELAVLREHRQPVPGRPERTQYWGCPHGPGRFCCKPENQGKRLEIDVFWPGQKRYK
jgi:hypothetical protein